ncbi:methylase involved in ubiquinone/menaquinone biosynthesis [Methyloglobulus morosus KoM1]|uniref:Methylase involved in ubiquinone/menaquinone biosynthesis n=1 Tax=Methyloglobulus morosus KoM1 TaxID=1116472 RepID=V5C8Q1_9GAMM|nr:class I SAM-dependent methyltransferase [Methyloglobulus morosus]ESS73078.1 methylase involved in ubiquinone/menaquinone biosynthesis [Methyloglobulus morosus KoM1]
MQIDSGIEKSLQKFWNDYAEPYSLLHESCVYYQLMQQTLEFAQITPGIKCLDLACGPGNYACELVKNGAKVVGVDYSEKMIAIAQNRISQHTALNENISLIQMDVLDYLKTVPDNFFDVIIAALFLSYIPYPDEVIKEIYRILKPDGHFVMSNPRPNANFSHVFIDSIRDILRNPLIFIPVSLRIWIYAKRIERFSKNGVFHFFSQIETCQLLTSIGFDAGNIKFMETFSKQVYLVCAEKRKL